MTHSDWELAMGMRGYRGSPAEKEDRSLGLVVGGKCRLNADGRPVGVIDHIEVDNDGDPWFHLSFSATDKPVRVERDEVLPL